MEQSFAATARGLVLAGWLVAALGQITMPPAAMAGDFSRAKKVYVPATKIDRRVDYSSQSAAVGYAGVGESSGGGGAPTGTSSGSPPMDIIRRKSTPASIKAAGSAGGQPMPSGGSVSAMPTASGLVPPPPPLAPPILPVSSGITTVPPPPSMKSQPARHTLVSGKSAGGQAAFSAADPLATSAHAKAQELIKQGKLDDADLILRSAYKNNPKNSMMVSDLANLSVERSKKFLAAKDLEGATKAAREALYVSPGSVPAASQLDAVLKASGVNPTDAAERVRLGDLLASQGRDTAAKVEYRQALRLKPTAAAHVGLGNMALRSENKIQAKSEYQSALEIDPNSAIAHRQMGLLRLGQGDTVGANSDLSRAVILDPADKVAGKHLVELWQRQVSKLPGDANMHMGLARAHQMTGDLKSAQNEYRQVVRIDPNNPNLAAARQSFKLALSKQDSDRALTAARTLESEGALNAAHQKVTEALSLNPGDAKTRLYHGQILEKIGQVPQARDAYMQVLRDDPNNLAAAQRLRAISGEPPVALRATEGRLAQSHGAPPFIEAPPSGAPPFVEAPPLATLPAPQDQVSALSNFLVNLRNHSLSEQGRMQQVEEQTHSTLKALKASPQSLSGSVAAQAPSALPDPTAALASARAAIAQAGGAPTSAGAVAVGVGSAAAAGVASTAVGALTANRAPVQAPQSIQQQSQPQGAVPYGQPVPYTGPPMQFARDQMVPQSGYPQGAAPQPPGAYAPPPYGQPVPYTGPPLQFPHSQTPPPGYMPNMQPMQQSPPMQQQSMQQRPPTQPIMTLAQPPNVKLELEGFTPGRNEVELKVLLRNDQDVALNLPGKPTVVVRNKVGPEVHSRASFPDKTVAAHGQLRGTIKIPRENVDASSDLFIEDVLPAGSAYRNLHLTTATTPVSYRQ